MFANKIFELKEELIKWKKELLNLLSNNYIYQKRIVYLIGKSYLDKFENIFFKNDNMNNKTNLNSLLQNYDPIYNETNELFNELNNSNIELNKLPRIFPLNEETYKYFQNNILNKDNNNNIPEVDGIKGLFAESLLEIKITKLLHLFFFIYGGYLRQGFLYMKDENVSGNILNELKKNSPTYFVKNYTGEKINDDEVYIEQPEFNLFILGKFDINIEKLKIEFEKINQEKSLKFRSKTMRIPAYKLNLIKVDKEVKNFVNKYDKNILGLDNMFNSTFSSKKLIRNRGSTIYHNNKFSFAMSEKNLKNELKKEQNNNNIYYNNKSNNDNNQIDNNLYENNINNDYQDEYIKNDNNNINDNNIDSNNNLRYTMTMINNSIPNYNPEKTQIIQSIIPESDEFNKIEEPGEPNPSEEMEEEKLCGLIGLDNIGATCYMNATLQCFSNVEFLREEFLTADFYSILEQNKLLKMRLSFALAEVFKNLWLKFDIKSYPPQHFKEVISEMNPLFKGIAANDPKDLILFMLETMHNELKTVNSDIIVDDDFIPDERKLEEVYKDFSNYYLSKNKSIIFDIFYGCTNIVTGCLRCKTESHNVQVSNIIFFPLEEVRKFRNYNNETPVNVYDCFEYNRRMDVYYSYYCNYCHYNDSTAVSFTRYLYTPKVMIINLNRGKGIQFHVKFSFEEFLDIRNFVAAQDSPYKYELIGVICHFGESGMGGHFIAFCKHFDYMGSKWYKFNDGFVNETNFNEVQTVGMPYVLFYSYIDIAN